MKPISKFLCSCAGANLQLISKYPSEISRYNSIGATIIFTGFFAALSGGYAFYKIFNNMSISIILGIVWGLMIFNLDRYIVMSMKKTGGFFSKIKTTIPRIVLAIIISFVIAKPLEIRIFADRIAREIGDQEISQMVEERNTLNNIYNIDEAQVVINNLNTELNNVQAAQNKELDNNYITGLKNQIVSLNTQIESKDKERKNLQSKISKFFRNYTYSKMVNGVEVQKPATRSKHLPKNEWSKISSTVTKRDHLKSEIITLNQKINTINQKISNANIKHREQLNEKYNTLTEQKKIKDNLKENADLELNDKLRKMDSINNIAFTDNFITQLEALGRLTEYKEDKFDENNVLLLKANNTLFWVNLGLVFLFIIIETAPILVKLLSGKGYYEIALEAEFNTIEASIIEKANTHVLHYENKENAERKYYLLNEEKRFAVFEKLTDTWKENQFKELDNITDNEDLNEILKRIKEFDINKFT